MTVELHLKRLERKVDKLIEKSGPKWVRAGVIMELTGWDKQRMKVARVNKEIEFKVEEGMWYDLNTLHPFMLKTKQ